MLERLRDAYGDGFDELLMVLISAALLLTGGLILLRALALSEARRREREHLKMDTRHKVAAVVLGFSIGVVLGVTSAGSGTLIAVGLIVGFRLTPHLVVGTDVVHAAVLLWVASARPPGVRQRRLRAGGHDPDRLDPGRVDRHEPQHQAAGRRAAAGARHRAGRVRAGAAARRRG